MQQYYGSTLSKATGEEVATFDFVSIQLYESYSHAVYNVSVMATPPAEYLVAFVQTVLAGWEVDFSTLPAPPGYPTPSFQTQRKITIPPSQLVIGRVTSRTPTRWPRTHSHITHHPLQPNFAITVGILIQTLIYFTH